MTEGRINLSRRCRDLALVLVHLALVLVPVVRPVAMRHLSWLWLPKMPRACSPLFDSLMGWGWRGEGRLEECVCGGVLGGGKRWLRNVLEECCDVCVRGSIKSSN